MNQNPYASPQVESQPMFSSKAKVAFFGVMTGANFMGIIGNAAQNRPFFSAWCLVACVLCAIGMYGNYADTSDE